MNLLSRNRWVPAAKLRKGEHLRTPDRSIATANGGATPKNHDGWMYDLTVQDDHDFYVQPEADVRDQAATPDVAPVLAHNDVCRVLPFRFGRKTEPSSCAQRTGNDTVT